ncbi:MAG: DUF2007 domain-containing protein [bacterium]
MKQIYIVPNRAIAHMIRGVLENNHIPAMIQPYTPLAAAQYADGYMQILVPEDKEYEAKHLLSSFFDSI